MAEKLNGFVCRLKKTGQLCGFRKADGKPNEWHTWTDQQSVEEYTGDLGEILPAVTYIGPDALDWRKRPTCPGDWLQHATNKVIRFRSDDISAKLADRGPWFGPIPSLPEVTT